jgi:3-isopropylmalate/(R)-2-methylmalate dehydratase large subunit
MAVKAGAETGLFPADPVTMQFLAGRARYPGTAERSDADAEFARRIQPDLGRLSTPVGLPHSPEDVASVEAVAGRKVDQVYIGNCANGTTTDLRQTAEVLRGAEGAPELSAYYRSGDSPDLPSGSS